MGGPNGCETLPASVGDQKWMQELKRFSKRTTTADQKKRDRIIWTVERSPQWWARPEWKLIQRSSSRSPASPGTHTAPVAPRHRPLKNLKRSGPVKENERFMERNSASIGQQNSDEHEEGRTDITTGIRIVLGEPQCPRRFA